MKAAMDRRNSEYRPLFDGPTDRPLFGEENSRDRIIHMGIAIGTATLVLITVILAFFFPFPPCARHIYFSICIIVLCLSHIMLIHWYRQGDVDPKFRQLIYANTFIIVMFCISALTYITQKREC